MIAVCWKWTGATSAADRAALEVALGLSPAGDVTVVSVGPPAADAALREALAVGAGRVVRVDAPGGLASADVARALAPVCGRAEWVVCGDVSADRGTGAVPAFLAAELGSGQALGLVSVRAGADGTLRVIRRLDGGRREVLDAPPGTVLSVEGAAASLRRASLPAELAAGRATIEVRRAPPAHPEPTGEPRPYRPRPRPVPVPSGDAGDRIRWLTGVSDETEAASSEVVALAPPAAAACIVEHLRAWGYLVAPS